MVASQYQVLYSSFFLEKVILSYQSVFETKTMINWFSLVYTMIFKRFIKGYWLSTLHVKNVGLCNS